MILLAALRIQSVEGHFTLASLLGFLGVFLLLPKPKVRSIAGGIAALIASLAVFVVALMHGFGQPMPDLIGTILFCLFSLGALGFGIVLVVQRNPARGAIAFAFVILSTCGLFLLLAAPFLMAATIIIYAGAIIVTFLFVLMLSQSAGPSDENDRTREPLLGSFVGFAFAGLVLFALYETQKTVETGDADSGSRVFNRLPAQVITPHERESLAKISDQLKAFEEESFYLPPGQANRTSLDRMTSSNEVERTLEEIVGVIREESTIRDGSIRERLSVRTDSQAKLVLAKTAEVRDLSAKVFREVEKSITDRTRAKPAEARENARRLREEVFLLAGVGQLPARNIQPIGLLLYSEHLLAVELGGTILLAATIGAVAIAHRRGVTA